MELEVAHRTVLRGIDALSEAGLPIIAYQGNQGGFELGFSYRTRLTGLAADEAAALGVLLGRAAPELDDLGLGEAGKRARTKLLESLPDGVRRTAQDASTRFLVEVTMPEDDDRVPALADAIRGGRVVRVRSTDVEPRTVHPVGLLLRDGAWWLLDGLDPDRPIALADCGTVNISRRTFAEAADL